MLRKKYFKIGPYGLMALVLILLASTLRIIVIAQGWPLANSDEGTMGLMARHIAYRGELPIFFYGQTYMGALEAYIGAPLFYLFGPSFFSLRLGLVLCYAAFLLALYLLTSILYSKKLALVTLLLLCFGSIEMFTRQLRAVGGDEETMLFGTLIMLFTALLVLSFDRAGLTTERKRRFILHTCLGLSMGLGLWSHTLVAPFVAAAVVSLFIFCRSELRGRTLLLLLGGFIVGLLPLLIFNVKYPLENSLATIWNLHSSGGLGTVAPPYNVWDELRGTVLVSLPMTTGANPICTLSDVPGQWRAQISRCLVFQGSWGVGYILLLALAILLTVRALQHYWQVGIAQNSEYPQGDSPANRANGTRRTRLFWVSWSRSIERAAEEERQQIRLQALRLMLLGSAALTLLTYMFSAAPALVPITSTRYLVGLLVATPALLSPLWYGVRNGKLAVDGFKNRVVSVVGIVVRGGLLLFIFALLVNGTISVFQDVPRVQALNQQEGKLASDLVQHHVTRMYSEYWTCDLVMFLSNERIACSSVQAVDGKLTAGQNRYPLYTTIVQQDAQADYVLTVGSPEAAAFAQQIAQSGKRYQSFIMDGYIIYQPT